MKQLITIILIKILSVVHIVEVYILYKYSFNKGCTLVADSKPTNTLFANLIGAKCKDLVSSNKHTIKKGNSIVSINGLHAELNKLNNTRNGISTRHLPYYLSWLIFSKNIKYVSEPKFGQNNKSDTYAMHKIIKFIFDF